MWLPESVWKAAEFPGLTTLPGFNIVSVLIAKHKMKKKLLSNLLTQDSIPREDSYVAYVPLTC